MNNTSLRLVYNKLPLYRSRSDLINGFLAANALFYGYYVLSSGPTRNWYQKNFTINQNGSPLSLLTSHFFHTDPWSFLFNAGALYTIGNYHVLKYGNAHFAAVFGLAGVTGAALAYAYLGSDRNANAAGGLAGSSGVLVYNLLRNPAWFTWGPSALTWLAVLSFYGFDTGNRYLNGGLLGGYLTFLFAL